MQTEENKKRADMICDLIHGVYEDQDLPDSISSVLTDLRHLCDREDLDFAQLDAAARTSYRAETFSEPIVDYQTGQVRERED